jgi:hypothetical protein
MLPQFTRADAYIEQRFTAIIAQIRQDATTGILAGYPQYGVFDCDAWQIIESANEYAVEQYAHGVATWAAIISRI